VTGTANRFWLQNLDSAVSLVVGLVVGTVTVVGARNGERKFPRRAVACSTGRPVHLPLKLPGSVHRPTSKNDKFSLKKSPPATIVTGNDIHFNNKLISGVTGTSLLFQV
jgi:hypothetical protein